MRLKTILTFIFSLLVFSAIAQDGYTPGNIIKNGKWAQLIGFNYNSLYFVELGLARGWRCSYQHHCKNQTQELNYTYGALSCEFPLATDQKFIFGPKLTYHFIFTYFDIGITTIYYTNFNENKFAARPELGLTLGGMIGVTYGRNLGTNNDNFGLSDNNVTLRIIVNSGLNQ